MFQSGIRGWFSRIIVMLCLLCVGANRAEANLVPNPSFEAHSNCPTNFDQFPLVTTWSQPTLGTSDYYNACSSGNFDVPTNYGGTQAALTGDAYAAIRLWDGNHNSLTWREYIEVPLTSSLIANQSYQASFYVSLADISIYATDAIGMYFSNGQVGHVNISGALPFTPQVTNPANRFLDDKDNWMLVSGTFTATGGEDHIVIGNFLDNDSSSSVLLNTGTTGFSYVYIDDVSVVTVPEPLAVWLFCSGIMGLHHITRRSRMIN